MKPHILIIWAVKVLLVVLLSACGGSIEIPDDVQKATANLPDKLDYNLHVKPILSDRCFACHGPDKNKQKADLRLDIADAAYDKECESGLKAIAKGNPAKSDVVHRILSDNPDYVMPEPSTHLTLSAEEKATIIKWIEQGAEYKPHWSFVAPVKPELPEVKHTAWVKNDIDRFVLKKLEAQHLTPQTEAPKTTLLRRVYMDLIGLPPTTQQVAAFLKDNSPNAYETVVNQLLANPHFGEHQAVDWLDVARYADTHGYQDDGLRTMWPYRDWVIKSFNRNLAFDRFVTWQLAGDLLPNPQREHLIATAFNRNHQQSQEGGIVPQEYFVEYIADRTNTFGKAFLGLTVECARCHDHKYDPISQKDYYSLSAFFNNNNEYGQIPYNGEPSPSVTLPKPEAEKKLRFIKKELAKIENTQLKNASPVRQRFEKWLAKGENAPLILPQSALMIDVPFDSIDVRMSGEKKDKKRPIFKNLANDTLHLETNGDLDFLPVSIKSPRGKGVRLVGESFLQMRGINGWGEYKEVPTISGFFERNQPFTVSLWVGVIDPKFKGPLFNRNLGPFNGFRGYECERLEDGRLAFRLSNVWPDNAIDFETDYVLKANRWAHITMTYDGSSKANGLKVYINGQRATGRVMSDGLRESMLWGKNHTNWGAGAPNFSIGQRHDYNYKGYAVDELKVFARELTPLEVHTVIGHKDFLKMALKTPAEKRTQFQKEGLFDYYATHIDTENQKLFSERKQLIGEETEVLNKEIDVMVMRERKYPRKTHILKRGAYDAPDQEVTADTPDEFFKIPKDFPRNRLGLAQWLLHQENPLFARVMVNRMWQRYFGKGLVISAEDFGNQGDLPTHLELLDYLAVKFRESGWNYKMLQKYIVMSATYRQSSVCDEKLRELDPNNALYARGPSYRISAEQVRDAALAASGLLSSNIGGPSVHPYQPDGIWEALATRNAVQYVQNHGDTLYRRSMYTIWKRSSPPPMMLNFDASERHFCSVRRQKTSTPLQALVTLNDPQFVEAARVLAQRSVKGQMQNVEVKKSIHQFAFDPRHSISYIFTSLTSRPPRPNELKAMTQLYLEEYQDFVKNPKRADELLTVGEYPVDKSLNKNELAAMTIVASTGMNFDEFVIKR
jgi:cytochrome c553